MFSKRVKKILVGLLLLTSLAGIGITSCVANKKSDQQPQQQYTQVIDISDKQQIKIESETVVNGLKELSELNVLSVSMNKTINIQDKGFMSNRNKDVNFTLTGYYYADLSTLNVNAVQVNDMSQQIDIFMKPLQMRTTFEEDMTLFGETEKDKWYDVFGGDVEIKPEKMEQIKAQLKGIILDEMAKSENLDCAEEKAQEQIQRLVNTITKSNYKINITYIK